MSAFRRAQNAFLTGGNQIMKNIFLGDENNEHNSKSPNKQKIGLSFRRRKNTQQKSHEDGNNSSTPNGQVEACRMGSGSDPAKTPRAVTQTDFVDALTAVVTQSGTRSSPECDDDQWSISSVSTINSQLDLGLPLLKDENPVSSSGPSFGIGQLFFYLDQNHFPLLESVLPSSEPNNIVSIPTGCPIGMNDPQPSHMSSANKKQDASFKVPQPQQRFHNSRNKSALNNSKKSTETRMQIEETQKDDTVSMKLQQDSVKHRQGGIETKNDSTSLGCSVSRIRAMIEAKTMEANHDGLFQRGCEMFEEGERLLKEGKVHEAREALLRARSFQKRSLQTISRRMANLMHQQGLEHSDRGDTYLAVILLGVAEVMKHRPSASNIHLGAQVHRGYRRICPKEQKFREARKEMDVALKAIEHEAKPFSRTLQVYSRSLMIDTIPEEIPAH